MLAKMLVLLISQQSYWKPIFTDARTWIQTLLAFIVPILLPCAIEVRKIEPLSPAFFAQAALVVLMTVELGLLAEYLANILLRAKRINGVLATLVLTSAGLGILSLLLVSVNEGAVNQTVIHVSPESCQAFAEYCKGAVASLPQFTNPKLVESLLAPASSLRRIPGMSCGTMLGNPSRPIPSTARR